MNQDHLRKRIDVSTKRIPADVVVKNGKIIDVFNLEMIEADIAIVDGYIAGIGEYDGHETIDATGKYVSPAFIDGHVHIESSMVTPLEFSKVLLAHGVTTVITDPHEIGNVSGTTGIRFMLDQSEGLPLDVRVMLPSSVPATPFENAGATLKAPDLEPFYKHPRVLGLAEVMDFPAVFKGDNDMLSKIVSAANYNGIIDGHAAGLDANGINVYRSSLITTDHECTTAVEALDRIRRGMYVLIREGSVAKNLKVLIKAVTANNARRFLFCTDDKHLDDLVAEGSVDHNVRIAIKEGISPLQAIQLATLNAAECYGLDEKGAISPGRVADFILLDDLDTISISEVFVGGKSVAKDGAFTGKQANMEKPTALLTQSVNLPKIGSEKLAIPINTGDSIYVIEVIPNQLVTKKKVFPAITENGCFTPSVSDDLLKMAVIERHKQTGNIGLGVVKGLLIKNGAIASTVAHDSHNLVVCGTNDEDMLVAIEAILNMQGGYVIVKNGKVLASVPLPISGLMSDQPFTKVNEEIIHLKAKLKDLGFTGDFDPFLTLSFLTLPVIPEMKLTDLGLFDFKTFQHISVKAD
ncbi:adenosine deaminase [Fictibacillus phosphorivorans]|uniref:Adenine deaminase n=1 Tax=Fictibacillus phosphorivorans TaxID=1221500 RepID=A0A161SYK5_9BACL|nr:adenine deaminase [Fictibacillus phosphorivorans]KZE63773.1 adenosine deaminase [Fictibacillus phosphorivorans]